MTATKPKRFDTFTFRVDPVEMDWFRAIAAHHQTTVADLLRTALATEGIKAGVPAPAQFLRTEAIA